MVAAFSCSDCASASSSYRVVPASCRSAAAMHPTDDKRNKQATASQHATLLRARFDADWRKIVQWINGNKSERTAA